MEQEQAMLQSLYAMTQVLAENRKHSPLSVHAHEIGHFSALRYTLTRLPDAPCVMDLNQKNLRWYQLLLENKESTLRLESTIVLPSNNVSKPCKKQRIIQSSVVALAFI